MTDTKQVVLDFFECWHRLDLADASTYMADDAVFNADCKSAAVHGRAAIEAIWAMYMKAMAKYDVTYGPILASDTLVFVERIEYLEMQDARKMVFPIVGVFEFNAAGKIAAWRDYFDTSMVTAS